VKAFSEGTKLSN